jgi:hypothetical protein
MSKCRRVFSGAIGLLVMFMFLGSSGLAGQEKTEVNVKTDASGVEADGAVGQAALAAEMAAYGYAEKAPLALVSAARIVIAQAVDVVDRDKESEGGEEGEAKSGGVDVSLDAEKLLADAEEMAAGDEVIVELIGRVRQEAVTVTRGRVGGPASHYDEVLARTTDVYTMSFRGGEWAEIRVRGDGDTDLDCYVYDQNGNLIDSDTDYTDYCILGWVPRWTGSFTLRIQNLGWVWNGYILVTN